MINPRPAQAVNVKAMSLSKAQARQEEAVLWIREYKLWASNVAERTWALLNENQAWRHPLDVGLAQCTQGHTSDG